MSSHTFFRQQFTEKNHWFLKATDNEMVFKTML